jgi:hypothetical protein
MIGIVAVIIIIAIVTVLLGMVSPAYAQSINFTKLEDRYTHEYSPDPSLVQRADELGYGEFVNGIREQKEGEFGFYPSDTRDVSLLTKQKS